MSTMHHIDIYRQQFLFLCKHKIDVIINYLLAFPDECSNVISSNLIMLCTCVHVCCIS